MEKKRLGFVRVILVHSLIVFSLACNNENNVRIRIDSAKYANKYGLLEEQRVTGTKLIDTIDFNSKGISKYKFELRQSGYYNLHFENGERIFLVLHPQDNINITLTDDDKTIFGSDDSKKLNLLYDSLFVTREVLEILRQDYSLAINSNVADSLADEYDKVVQGYYMFSLQFLLENLTSLVSLASLYQEVAPQEYVFSHKKDLQYFKLVSDSLSKHYPKHRHVLALKRNFNTMFESYEVNRLMNSVDLVKSGLPDIKLPDPDSKIQSLYSQKQRYILLNFWTHNDQVTDKIFPALKSVYERYEKYGFTIYNVYMGKSLETWNKIIAFEEIEDWVNVADTSFPNSKLQMQYNIQSLPTNFLFDQQINDVLARDLNPAQLQQRLSRRLDE